VGLEIDEREGSGKSPSWLIDTAEFLTCARALSALRSKNVMRVLQPHEMHMNVFLRMAARLDRPGYPWYVALLDRLGGLYTKLTERA
jgi:hypothetical protein